MHSESVLRKQNNDTLVLHWITALPQIKHRESFGQLEAPKTYKKRDVVFH